MTSFHDSDRVRCAEIIEAGRFLNDRGWVPATSSNFSVRLDDGTVAVTVSGFHKGALTEEAVMRVDMGGQALDSSKRPSAETLLHTALYQRFPDVGAVLHTHSVNATVLSRLNEGQLVFEDYELLKALSGVSSHETSIIVPIFPNDQDIPRLSAEVESYMDSHPPIHGYLIAGHGLYTWGRDMAETLRHIEAFEFLFQCELTMQGLQRT
ncbi:MAG: methylthioribulose 1-phosphate dehydratase [Candidatus Thiodiazotropha sp.]